KPGQRRQRQSRPEDRKPLYITLAPYGGALAAVIVVSLLVWKLSHPGIDQAGIEPAVTAETKKVSDTVPPKAVATPTKPPPTVAAKPVPAPPPPVLTQNPRLRE